MSAGADDRDGGFLARWSRRKRESAVRKDAPTVSASATDPLPPAGGGEGLGMGGRKAGEPAPAVAPSGTTPHPDPPHRERGEGEDWSAQAEPEPVEPPSLDLIDKDFDLAHWLKQNVPESWKLAALRRAWLADPTIRNFENPARDYALDWNTPGGAPGYGPLTESDDVGAMIRQIFGDAPEPAAADVAAATTGDSMPHQLSSKDESGGANAAMRQNHAAPELATVRRSEDPGQEDAKPPDSARKSSESALAALQENSARKAEPVRIRKRGGGAIPV